MLLRAVTILVVALLLVAGSTAAQMNKPSLVVIAITLEQGMLEVDVPAEGKINWIYTFTQVGQSAMATGSKTTIRFGDPGCDKPGLTLSKPADVVIEFGPEDASTTKHEGESRFEVTASATTSRGVDIGCTFTLRADAVNPAISETEESRGTFIAQVGCHATDAEPQCVIGNATADPASASTKPSPWPAAPLGVALLAAAALRFGRRRT